MKIKKFEDFEYRKGSNEFGTITTKIMEWLRIHKTEAGITKIKTSLEKFLSETNTTLEELQKLINSKHNLYNFKIRIDNDYITFYNLNDSKKTGLPWNESIVKFESFN
jgi:hypothetical protein